MGRSFARGRCFRLFVAGSVLAFGAGTGGCVTDIEQSGGAVSPSVVVTQKDGPEREEEMDLDDVKPCEKKPLVEGNNWDERYPDTKGYSWDTVARTSEVSQCIHDARDISRIVLYLRTYELRHVQLTVDLETGRFFTTRASSGLAGYDEVSSSSKFFPPEAVDELYGILGEAEITSWQFMGFDLSDRDDRFGYRENNTYEVALLYKDGTASYQTRWPHKKARDLTPRLADFIRTHTPESAEELIKERS